MRKANFSSGGTFSRYQSNKIRQLLGEETIIHLNHVTEKFLRMEWTKRAIITPPGKLDNPVSAETNQVFIGTKLCSISRRSPVLQPGTGICNFILIRLIENITIETRQNHIIH